MGFCSITVTFIVGIRFNDGCIREVFLKKSLYPFTGNDIGPVLFAGMKFYTHFTVNLTVYLFISCNQSIGREIPREVNHGFLSVPLPVGDILIAILDG